MRAPFTALLNEQRDALLDHLNPAIWWHTACMEFRDITFVNGAAGEASTGCAHRAAARSRPLGRVDPFGDTMRATRILAAASSAILALHSSVAFAQPPSFARSDISTGLTLTGDVIAGDFNSDGMPDLLVASHSLAENFGIYLLLGNGDGTFAPPAHVFSPSFGSSLAAADVNGDG
jgi:hypothetical protein